MEKKLQQMTLYEKSAIIGYHRNGMETDLIAYLMGISESYVRSIIREYFKKKLV